MAPLSGIYVALDPTFVSGAAVIVKQPDPTDPAKLAHRGPICVAACEAIGNGGAADLTVEKGTWDGAIFTPIQTIARILALSGDTRQVFPFAYLLKNEAIRITTVGASTIAFVRTQGQTAQVSP
jgi:hypothetical protein